MPDNVIPSDGKDRTKEPAPISQDDVPYAIDHTDPLPKVWPDPTPDMLASPQFDAVWQCIRTWDIAVPAAYTGYCGATGNHVRAILDALAPFLLRVDQLTLRPDPASVLVVTLPAGQTDHIYEQLVEHLRALFKHGPEWEDVRIPMLFLEDGITLAQVDEDSMRAAGWVRLPAEEPAP
jgi:hypothetical protein